MIDLKSERRDQSGGGGGEDWEVREKGGVCVYVYVWLFRKGTKEKKRASERAREREREREEIIACLCVESSRGALLEADDVFITCSRR